jgi:hypothetical protein
MTPRRILFCAVLIGATAAVIGLASGALAAQQVEPVSPLDGVTVPRGESPTFRMQVRGSGQVWVRVCRTRRLSRDGVICAGESLGRARRNGGTHEYKPRYHDFPEFWLNRAGTYYWQGYRVVCDTRGRDCRRQGPVVRFQVG